MRRAQTLIAISLAVLGLAWAFAWTLRAHNTQTPVASADLSDADVLFREALRRGYAMDDLIVRRQLVRRMHDALLQEHPLREPDDTTLSAYLAQHADRYRAPARYSFDQVYLSRGQQGADLHKAAAQLAAHLHAAPEQFARFGDPFPRGSHLDRLNAVQIEADFGHALAVAIAALPQGTWQGPLESPLGLHFIRVTAIEPARALTLAEARTRLLVDHRQMQQAQVMRDALTQLRQDFSNAPPLPQPAALQDEDLP